MTINPLLRQLRELTEVDALLVQTRDQLATYPRQIAKMDQALDEQRSAFQNAKDAIARAQHDRRQAEKDVQDLRARVARYVKQQAQVKTEKESEAITQEMASLEKKIDDLETRGLECLEAEERESALLRRAEAEIARLEREQAPERDRIREQIIDKQERHARLTSEQKRKFEQLPDEWQQTYALMNERIPGSVAVPMEQGQCGGCHWALVAATQQAIRGGGEIIRCDHCRRILYDPIER